MKLNRQQYRAAVITDGPVLVLAGPGSGKTHLLVERIRMMIEEKHILPENILVITFSQKAARQMQARFQKCVEGKSYPVTFGTFHAVFYHILQEFDPNINRLITEQEQRIFVQTLKDGFDLFDEYTETEDVIGMISSYRNLSDDFFVRDERGRGMDEAHQEEFVKLAASYERLCRQEGVIDFDDMIIMCDAVLRKHEMFLRKQQKRFKYFLVDEFQDINEAQYDVLRLLAGDLMNVFAVGDDDQSIYAFRGSRPQLMKKFLSQYKGCTQVTLTMNYRCCENVIGAADTLIRHNSDRLERPMQCHLKQNAGGSVVTVHSENTSVQAAFVCDMISHLMETYGYTAGDFAVLYRSEHCASMFIKTAQERGYKLRRTGEAEAKSKKQKIYEAYVRAKQGSADRADYFLIMNNPPRGLSREALCDVTADYLSAFRTFYADDAKMLEKVDDLERTIADAGHMKPEEEHTDPKDMINVMSAHASKGLEFKCVFVIGLQEGLFPHYKSMTGGMDMEERRLMYVAMTRAKERLYICSLGTEHGKRPSRFVYECMENKKYISDSLYLTRV